MSFEYSDVLLSEDKGRYFEKLKLAGLDDCPYKLPADRWINDPKQWPAIEYGDVYNYLIKSPGKFSVHIVLCSDQAWELAERKNSEN